MASADGSVTHKIGSVLLKPKYAAIAIVSWLLTLGVLLWLFSLDTLLYVLVLPNYATSEKFGFFLSPFVNSFIFFFEDPVTASRMIFSLLAGVSVALFVYVRRNRPGGRLQGKGRIAGLTLLLSGSGCIACGTSLISPLLIGAGAGTSALIGAAIGTIGYLIGIVLLVRAIKKTALLIG